MSDVSPNTNIDSITLSYADNEQQDVVISTRLSIQEVIRAGDAQRWHENEDNLKYFRVRVITCLDSEPKPALPDTFSIPQCLDYWSQRFNEYSLLALFNVVDNSGNKYTPTSYIDHIHEVLKTNNSQTKNDSQPPHNIINMAQERFQPFNASFAASGGETNKYSQFYQGTMKNVIVTERALVDLLPRVRESDPTSRILSRSVEKFNVGQGNSMDVYELIDLPPIDLYVGPSYEVSNITFSHLSVYAFVYFDYSNYIMDLPGIDLPMDGDQQTPSVLEEGIGVISNATPIGIRTKFEPLLGDTVPVMEEQVTYVENGEIIETQIDTRTASVVNWGMV
tara:strand:- start:3021 stop:4028 length:1008 start_codon:yes stop_codon:yes gene_type:complete